MTPLQVDAAFGETVRQLEFHIEPQACSRFGAAEHNLQSALAHQKALLASRLNEQLTTPATSAAEHGSSILAELADVGVHLMDADAAGAAEHQSPVAFAKQLCDAATLNRDQRRPVALIARELERAW